MTSQKSTLTDAGTPPPPGPATSAGSSSKTVEKFGHRATLEESGENDYNLSIPRNVDAFVEEAEINLPAIQQEIGGSMPISPQSGSKGAVTLKNSASRRKRVETSILGVLTIFLVQTPAASESSSSPKNTVETSIPDV